MRFVFQAKAVTLAVAQAFQAAKTQFEKEEKEAERKRYEVRNDKRAVR